MTPKTGFRQAKPAIGIEAGADSVIKDLKSIEGKRICIALSGGRSAERFYPALKKRLGSIKGKEISFFLLDERLSTKERNSTLIKKILGSGDFNFLGNGRREELLRRYNQDLKRKCGNRGFDMIIGGVGEDGHIASLFPGSKQLDDKRRGYILVDDSPKPPRMRITASPELIRKARFIYLLFIGKSKQGALKVFTSPKGDIQSCPAKLAKGSNLRIIAEMRG